MTSAEDRYAMTVLATAANADFIASRFEIDRPGITYTVDTLGDLRSHYPDNVELYFITGADAIMDILAWHDAESMASLVTLIAATRPGYDINQAKGRVEASGIVRRSLHRDSGARHQLYEHSASWSARARAFGTSPRNR